MAFFKCVPIQSGELPSGYTKLLYLENTSTQYIKTGIIPTNTHGMLIDLIVTHDTSEDKNIDGCRIQGGQRWMINHASNKWGYGFGAFASTSYSCAKGAEYVVGLNYQNSRKFSVGTNSVSISGSLTSTMPEAYIFAQNPGSNNFVPLSQKIYSAKFSNGSDIIMSLIPSLNPSGVAGMYDTIGKQFLTNAGTGSFGYEKTDGTYVAPV